MMIIIIIIIITGLFHASSFTLTTAWPPSTSWNCLYSILASVASQRPNRYTTGDGLVVLCRWLCTWRSRAKISRWSFRSLWRQFHTRNPEPRYQTSHMVSLSYLLYTVGIHARVHTRGGSTVRGEQEGRAHGPRAGQPSRSHRTHRQNMATSY